MIYTITVKEKNGDGEVSRDYFIDDYIDTVNIIENMVETLEKSKEVKF